MSTDGLAAGGGLRAGPAARREDRRWRLALAVALAFPAMMALVLFWDRPDTSAFAALFRQEAAMAVPGGAAGGAGSWRTVALPYHCPAVPDPGGCAVTLRIVHRAEPADGELWSLYVPSFLGGLTVRLNGVAIADSRWQRSAADITAASPMLVTLPPPLLRPGDNVFDLVLTKRGTIAGFLGPVAIAPDSRLRPDHDRRTFLFTTLPRMIDGWQLAMGLALLVLWLARRQEPIFLLCGVLFMINATQTLPALLGDGVDEGVYRFLNHGKAISSYLVLPLAWLFVGRRPPVPVWWFVVPGLAVAALQPLVSTQAHLWLVGTLLLPCGVVVMAWGIAVVLRAALVRRDSAAALLFGAFLTSLLTAGHDVLILRQDLGDRQVMVGRFAVPIVLAAVSAVLLWRFAQTMTALDRFSARLAREVAAAEDALRRSFAREQAQARTVAVQAERVRLMSDLHDGLAGQLVSILSLCELQGRERDEVTDAVGAALTDLRLIVASLEDYGDDLGVMLAVLRERIEPQAAAHGVTLLWRTAGVPDLQGLQPGQVLAIYRILQEAATNAFRHSGSATLAFAAGPSPRPGCGVRLSLRDHGRGGAVGRNGGYGLSSMRRRAERLGAGLDIRSGPDGTMVVLDLPERLPHS
ncbi:sensor histidine kinase [Azospirillum sp. ST 5-10]|uniref:sensor histidine kinase n=1 Tax=unclassified Azospirillum TaxID=2630922 RepID=UPI003F4A7319